MATKLIVKAAAAVVKLKDGERPAEVYIYRGALVPANADAEHVKHLTECGLLHRVTVADPQPTDAEKAAAEKAEAEKVAAEKAAADKAAADKTAAAKAAAAK